MARLVTKYQANDGTLFDSSSEAERYEQENRWRNTLSMLAYYTAGDLDPERLVEWLMAHREVVAEMQRWPRTQEEAVAEYLQLEETPERQHEDALFEDRQRDEHPEFYGKAPFPTFDRPAVPAAA